MIDSTNPRQLADNIRKLWDKFKSISGDLLPSRSTATTGQILKLTGENKTPSWADEYSYTPPAYSETEVNTGQKWIDGKEIYSIVLQGKTPDAETPNITILLSFDQIVLTEPYVVLADQIRPFSGIISYYAKPDGSGIVIVRPTSVGYQDADFYMIVNYTKPDPAPETREDDTEPEPEPEEKKTIRKKTTK